MRPMHDADSHIMEPPAWLEGHLAEEFRDRLPVMGAADAPSTQAFDIERLRRSHQNPEYRAEDESQILVRKNFFATGSFIEDDRPRALDLLGFASQLVFDTFTSPHVLRIGGLFDVGGKCDAGSVQGNGRFVADVLQFFLQIDLFADQLAVFEERLVGGTEHQQSVVTIEQDILAGL